MRSVEFGSFCLDIDSLELTRNGEPISLQRQPAQVLRHLLRHSYRVVTRSEICEAVWAPGTHVSLNVSLNYCVRQVRRALGDDASAPTYIETLPRIGFRWVGPPCVARATGAPGAELPPSRPRVSLVMGWLPGVVLATLTVLALRVVPPAERTARDPAGRPLSIELPRVVRAMHVFAHAVIDPTWKGDAAGAARELWVATVGQVGGR